MGFEGLAPSAPLLLAGLFLDALLGDPQVRWHPIRAMGDMLTGFEKVLRRVGLDGYMGGCLLFVLLAVVWILFPSALVHWIYGWNEKAGWLVHALIIYILFALRDLVDHVRVAQRAADRNDLPETHAAIAMFVGRDTDKMDFAACRRASIESLGESFVDGFLSALFWYVLAGLPGLLLFKIVSTMDSMVGYKTPRYLKFGWCGARFDDVLNFIPARLAWVLLGVAALPFPGLSAAKGWRVGLDQHAIIPGPNPGWSEATMAGLLQRRLIGPIWKNGKLVTEIWVGLSTDPPAGSTQDVSRALAVTIAAAVISTLLAVLLLY